MRRWIPFLIICFTSNIFSQITGDCDFWQSLDEKEQIVYVKGIYTGLSESLKILREEAIRQKTQDPYWVPSFVLDYSNSKLKEYYSEEVDYDYVLIAKLLNAFYSNPDNIHIRIMDGLQILILHQAGETRRANELLLIKQKELLKGR